MSCGGCNCSPCTCDTCNESAYDKTGLPGIDMSDPVNPHPSCGSVCSGDNTNNMWWRPGAEGFPGQCILDELTFGQVYAVLRRHPHAAEHLRRITNDETLLMLANSVGLVESEIVSNKRVTDKFNANTVVKPYYTLFRGNIDGTPGRGRSRR
jgi:hypothetical protein